MVDRIKQVMEYYELTPGEFADALGASRSSLTHIFSGRNQPSLDFARRVLMAFPEVSSEWLIMGVGMMIKPADAQVQTKQTYVQTDLFASAEEELGWGLDGEEMSDVRSQRSVVESEDVNENEKEIPLLSRRAAEGGVVENRTVEKSDLRSQKSEVESERGNGSSEELGIRNEEVKDNSVELGVRSEVSDVRSQISEVESEDGTENETNIPLPSRRGAEGGVVENENRNVNSDQTEVPVVTNNTNEPIQPQKQKITTSEKTPKMDAKQFDTKVVRQRRPLPSTSSESKIQTHSAPESRIYDSREPIAAPEKKVVKIIFFYDDDSFKIYHP